MGKDTKNMHFLSQCILKNFLPPDERKSLWVYDCNRKNTVYRRNIKDLFASNNIWGQPLEKLLSSDQYESRLGPLLIELNSRKIDILHKNDDGQLECSEFNAIPIDKKEEQSLLSKLVLQTFLMQKANGAATPDEHLEDLFSRSLNIGRPLLVEISPPFQNTPLIITDGMLFIFLTPDDSPRTLARLGFFFPISPKRFLLWITKKNDLDFFAQKYSNITYLNLCRIEQHDKLCTVACGNETYLKKLIPLICSFKSGDTVKISTTRND